MEYRKMVPWYSIKEAAVYLEIEEAMLLRKITNLNIETHHLPDKKGECLSGEDVSNLNEMIKGTRRLY